jgi:hypothetical protein
MAPANGGGNGTKGATTTTSTRGSGGSSGKKSPFERFRRRDEIIDWSSGFTLLGVYSIFSFLLSTQTRRSLYITDTFETYFDSHVDLFQRELKKRGDELRKRGDKLIMRADKTLENLKIKDLSGDLLTENFDREFKSFKIKVRRFIDFIL